MKVIAKMELEKVKKLICHGLISEARQLIEQYTIGTFNNDFFVQKDTNEGNLPLMTICVLINKESTAYNLCASLIEKGYKVNSMDNNGLCALNYAIIFEREMLVDLFLKTYDFNLDKLNDCYKNSLLHYVYAVNNKSIIFSVLTVYKKYYNWSK